MPTPKAGPNQVVIKIHASGLCYTDVHITQGMIPTQFPRVLGHQPWARSWKSVMAWSRAKIGDRVGLPWGCELLADIASGACAAKANFARIL